MSEAGFFSNILQVEPFCFFGGATDCKADPSLLLILKWGGELTPAGRDQAEELGRAFRCIYPGGQGKKTICTFPLLWNNWFQLSFFFIQIWAGFYF